MADSAYTQVKPPARPAAPDRKSAPKTPSAYTPAKSADTAHRPTKAS